jgi:LAO/AO transport system kinase
VSSQKSDSKLTPELEKLANGVLEGNRRALARAITLIESTRQDHRGAASAQLQRLMPHSGDSIRLGISGVPGSASQPSWKRWAIM